MTTTTPPRPRTDTDAHRVSVILAAVHQFHLIEAGRRRGCGYLLTPKGARR